jgi:hypothetical protein
MHNNCGPKCAKCKARKEEEAKGEILMPTPAPSSVPFLQSTFSSSTSEAQRSSWSWGANFDFKDIPDQTGKVIIITGDVVSLCM